MIAWRHVSLSLMLVAATAACQTRVLFIGNSYTYTNDLPGMFTALAASLGEDVVTGMSAPGGYTFNQHTQNTATLNALAQGDWDVVVLQEQSQLPSFPLGQVETECLPFAAALVDLARQANPCVKPVFLMTWGRENGDAQNCASWPPVCTYEGMQALLRERYLRMASDNSATCAAAGAVWREHRALYPGIGLYTDGSHPNALGSFIASTTLFSTVFRRPSTSSSFVPGGVDAAQAAAIRALSSSVVLDSAQVWNIGVNDPVAQADWMLLGGGEVYFMSNTVGAVDYTWHFGDGTSADGEDAFHIYSGSGPYDASLIVIDGCGRTDTLAFSVSASQGMSDVAAPSAITVHRAEGPALRVTSERPMAFFQVLDVSGRVLLSTSFAAGRTLLRLPGAAAGSLIWHARDADGQGFVGRVAPSTLAP